MNRHATLVHHRAWRLILTVATGNEDGRRTHASEVGEDVEAWYQIANIAALQVAQLLDAEYMAAEAMSSFADNPDLGRPENRRGGHRADRSRPLNLRCPGAQPQTASWEFQLAPRRFVASRGGPSARSGV